MTKSSIGLPLGITVTAISLFLILPILVVIPLSFNPEPYFSFTREMLLFEPGGWSLRWYREVTESDQWRLAFKNSLMIASIVTAVATVGGTSAALGLRHLTGISKSVVAGIIASPLVVPVIIVATGMYLFLAPLGLTQSFLGVVLAHIVLASPFVVVTVSGALSTFDDRLLLAAATLGASPFKAFGRVTLPLMASGILAGALFAFVTSFDEAVVTLFLAGYDQRTVPLQMWSGVRDQLSPAVLAVASLLVLLVAMVMAIANAIQSTLKRRNT